jgi:hypothetical protein
MTILSPRVIRLDSVHQARLLLYLNLVTAILVVFCASIVATRHPIGPSLPVILVGVGICSLLFAVPFWRLRRGWQAIVLFVIGVSAVLFVVWPAISSKTIVSTSGDSSNYVAFAQYLVRYPEGTAGGLAPIDQYASYFSGTRFATPALLAVLTQFSNGDPGLALVPLTILFLINVFAGFTLLARFLGCSVPLSIIVGVIALLTGWVPNMVFAGSFDNLLFVALFPFFLVRLQLLTLPGTRVRSILAAGICGAAVFYTYPEGLALAAIIFAPVLAGLLLRCWREKSRFWRVGLAALFGLIVSLPYCPTFVSFLAQQVQRSGRSMVGDAIFSGLKTLAFLPAAFALGEEFPGVPFSRADLVLALFLVLLAILGLIRWHRRNRTFIAAFFVFLALALWQGTLKHYSYGLYKVLTVGSIVAIPAIFSGLVEICRRLLPRNQVLATTCLGGVVVVVSCLAMAHNFRFTPKRIAVRLAPYSDLRNLPAITHDEPISLLCDNDLDQKWALIYLRDQPQDQRFERITIYHPELGTLIEGAKRPSAPARYYLVNRRMSGAIWSNAKFWLIPISSSFAPMIALEPQNGVSEINGAAFVWLSNRPSSFVIDAPSDGPAVVWAKNIRMGPSRPDDFVRTVVIRTAAGTSEQRVDNAFYALLDLKKGLNRVEIWCAEQPSIKVLPNGDPRALILGIEDYQVKPIDEHLGLIGVIHPAQNPESNQEGFSLWLSNERSTLLIWSPRQQTGYLRADQVNPRQNYGDVSERIIAINSNGVVEREDMKSSISVPIALKSGLNRVDLWSETSVKGGSSERGDFPNLIGLTRYRIESANN